MSCSICESEETTGRWHARRAYAYLPVCENCRTDESFKERYSSMVWKLGYRHSRPRYAASIPWCSHGMNFDGDCDGCTTESGGMVFVDIDDPNQSVPRRFVVSETEAMFLDS
jgi:hypothetical protein